MSIASEITRLQIAKADLKTAIQAKGVAVDQQTLDQYAALVAAISGLPSGMAMGEFKATSATMRGGFQIEHGLGAMPNLVIIYLAMTTLAAQFVHSATVVSLNEAYDEEGGVYYPEYSAQRVFCANSTGSSIAQIAGTMAGDVDRTSFWVPQVTTSYMYPPALTYKWIAVAIGG